MPGVGGKEGPGGVQNSNCDVRKGEEDIDPGITSLLKGSSEVRGPSGISLSVGGTIWGEGADQQWGVLAGGTNFDGTVVPWPMKAQRAGATPPGQDANSFMTNWKTSNPKTSYLGTGQPCPWADLCRYPFSCQVWWS